MATLDSHFSDIQPHKGLSHPHSLALVRCDQHLQQGGLNWGCLKEDPRRWHHGKNSFRVSFQCSIPFWDEAITELEHRLVIRTGRAAFCATLITVDAFF